METNLLHSWGLLWTFLPHRFLQLKAKKKKKKIKHRKLYYADAMQLKHGVIQTNLPYQPPTWCWMICKTKNSWIRIKGVMTHEYREIHHQQMPLCWKVVNRNPHGKSKSLNVVSIAIHEKFTFNKVIVHARVETRQRNRLHNGFTFS